MIAKEEAKELKKDIGPRHVAQISMHFIKNEIFNRVEEPYTSVFISRVLNGRVENQKVEKEIRFFAKLRKKEDEAEKSHQATRLFLSNPGIGSNENGICRS